MAAMYELSASEAARRIRAGALSPSNLVAACLKRIDATEPTVAAWVRLDRDAAARVAVQRDIEAREGRFMGPLHGVPIALKDIFDVAGVPTTSGAPDWAARTPTVDATSVARLRAAGAVPMGKLTTTPFAFLDPCATRNPWNPEHTPGGSSSGPAAAVAARMVPLALGSQTVGSVLRPAAYCGVVGFKPTHGRISAAGVLTLAESFDHVGFFARRVEDCALGLALLAGSDPADRYSSATPVDDYVAAIADPAPPRIGVLGALMARATPAMAAHLRSVRAALEAGGAQIVDVELPESFPVLRAAGEVVLAVDAAHAHAALYAKHAAAIRRASRSWSSGGGASPRSSTWRPRRRAGPRGPRWPASRPVTTRSSRRPSAPPRRAGSPPPAIRRSAPRSRSRACPRSRCRPGWRRACRWRSS